MNKSNSSRMTGRRLAQIFSLLILLVFDGSTFAAVVGTDDVGMQIVCCNDGVNVDALVQEYGLTPKFVYHYALNGFAATMNAATFQRLQADARVISVEADGVATLCDQTTPAGITRVGADTFPIGRSNGVAIPIDVGVAVLDTGIDPHPDLPPSYQTYFAFGTDGSDVGGSINDPNGHGTQVAGVLAAQDNGFGVVGVAPGVRIWNVKVTGPPPHGTWTDVIKGMDFTTANSNEISVANISISNGGAGAPIGAIKSALHRMTIAGIVVVVAAGNLTNDMAGADGIFGNGDDALPAALADAMAVSAMDPLSDTFAYFSNHSQIQRTNNNLDIAANMVVSPGLAIDVAAPGDNIYTTATGSNYVTWKGTSFAAPHVAGLVALYIAANGRATNEFGVYKIRQAIVNASLPQSQWRTNNTGDPDTYPEPLAIASLSWVPSTLPIAREPISQTICTSNSVSFGVVAVGSTFTYQWQINGTNLVDDGRIIGSTNNVLVITNVTPSDAGNYQVRVTDAASNNTTSTTAKLTVLPPNLVQNGSFETPVVVDFSHAYQQGYNASDTLDAWVVESTTSQLLVAAKSGYASASTELNWYPTPAGTQMVRLCSTIGGTVASLGTTVLRQDLATPLVAGTNYNLFFLQSGFLDFRVPAQMIVSLAPTGFTNEVYNQTFIVASNADWTRQTANFTVPSNGLYSLRFKSIPGTVAFVDDINLAPAPAVVTVTPPVFQNIARSGNAITLNWSAVIGQTHQLQYKTNLSQPNWINLGNPISATNVTVSTSDVIGNDPQRFYRVMAQ